ncbi:unnamed protein product, partial [Polarella glacialis]
FQKFDENGNGVITRSELAKVLRALDGQNWSKTKVDLLMTVIDTNGDGVIQTDELVSWIFGASKTEQGESRTLTLSADTNAAAAAEGAVDSLYSSEVVSAAARTSLANFRAAGAAAKAGW